MTLTAAAEFLALTVDAYKMTLLQIKMLKYLTQMYHYELNNLSDHHSDRYKGLTLFTVKHHF